MEVALVFLQRCDTEQVQYNGIVYTRIIHTKKCGLEGFERQ